ncbi:MAG: hypothetical protein LBS29_04800 [Endomicrobium sp.]|jgi:hypothetical protein|nr:hypothetical protein [Endomicrobium sp.]
MTNVNLSKLYVKAIHEYAEDSFHISETAYNQVGDVSEEMLELVEADNVSIYRKHENMVLKIQKEAWRLRAWNLTEVRRKYSFIKALVIYLEHNNIVLDCQYCTDLKKELYSLVNNIDKVELMGGEESNFYKAVMLNELAEKLEMREREQFLVDSLMKSIPSTSTIAWKNNSYDASSQVIKVLYPEYTKSINKSIVEIDKKYSDEENIKYIVDTLPSFRELLCDKIDLWKQLNVTPTTARLKYALNKDLTEAEANTILREVSAAKAFSSSSIYDSGFKESSIQRYYVENKHKNEAKSQFRHNYKTVKTKSNDDRKKSGLVLRFCAVVGIVAGVVIGSSTLFWCAIGILVLSMFYSK